jgi:hypothetical protein
MYAPGRRKALLRISYPKVHHYVFSHYRQRGAASRENVCNVFHQTRPRVFGKR